MLFFLVVHIKNWFWNQSLLFFETNLGLLVGLVLQEWEQKYNLKGVYQDIVPSGVQMRV